MPTLVYQKPEDRTYTVLEEGDYDFVVDEYSHGVSKGMKTAGCDTLTITMLVGDQAVPIKERFIFNEKTAWKICAFLQAIGASMKEGQQIDFTPKVCESLKGRIGRCRVVIETFEKRDGGTGQANRIAHFYAPPSEEGAKKDEVVKDVPEETIPF